jgi:Protein of unknown function (DUF2510)
VNDQPPVPRGPPAGWYQQGSRFRYWNGQAWTEHRLPEEEAAAEPVTASHLADRVTAIAGAITAAAALVVIPGGVAMWGRLQYAELPADLGVVASLPKQFLIAVGGAYILFPLLVVSGLAILVIVVAGERNKPNKVLFAEAASQEKTAVEHLSVWGFLGAAVVAMVVAVDPQTKLWTLAAAVLAVATALGWYFGARAISKRHSAAMTSAAAVALVATLTTAVFLPWAVVFSVFRGELPPTTVCRSDGSHLDGRLIGQTSDRVYVGESPEQIVLFLNEQPEPVQNDAYGALRNADYDTRIATSVDRISFGRVQLVVADLAELQGEHESDRLFDHPATDHLKVLAFGVPPEGVSGPEDFELVDFELVRDTDLLVARVDSEFESIDDDDRPELRITSVPSDQISRLHIGTLGSCPPTKSV